MSFVWQEFHNYFSTFWACWSFKNRITRKHHVSFQIMIYICSLSIMKSFSVCLYSVGSAENLSYILVFAKQSPWLSLSDSCLGLAIDLSAVSPSMHALNECNLYTHSSVFYPTMPFKRPRTLKLFNKNHLDWFSSSQIRIEGQVKFPVAVRYSHTPAAELGTLSQAIVQSRT